MTIELDDLAARALASIILQSTADATKDEGAGAAEALTALETDTGLALDVCAGILYAATWIAGAGGVEPLALFAAATALEPDDDEAPDDDEHETPGIHHEPDDDPAHDRAAGDHPDWPMTENVVGQVPKRLAKAAAAKPAANGDALAKSSDRDVEQWTPLSGDQVGQSTCAWCRCDAVMLTFGVRTCGFHMDHEADDDCPTCAEVTA